MPSLKTIIVVGAGEHLVTEDHPVRARDQILLMASAIPYPAGTVLGKVRGAQTVGAAVARTGNTGNGTVSQPTAASAQAAGRYGITFTSATAFNVEDAAGEQIGSGTTGTAFTKGGLSFTITAGSTAFVANDGFDITVSYAASSTFGPYDPNATDGRNMYAGVLFEGRPASTGVQRAVANVRGSVVNGNKVSYLVAVTNAQVAAAEAQGASIGVITRY